VVAEENRFIERERRKGAKLIVLDIPLLFETEAESRFHTVIVANAPAFMQRQRVMKRHGMTQDKFARILASQMPEREKHERAHAVILTGLGKAYSFRQLKSCESLWAIAQDLPQPSQGSCAMPVAFTGLKHEA
jgi:dephospho-CoA kinase